MARPVRFTEDAILDAALEEGSSQGFERVSASRVARRLGAPSGSIYHRYRSRDALMAALWLRTVQRFQAGYLAILGRDEPALERGRAAAQHVVTWCRKHPSAAQLLLRYRCEDLLSGEMPPAVKKRAATLNEPAARALRSLAAELSPGAPDIERARFACVTIPLAAVRDALVAGRRPPDGIDSLLDEAVVALLRRSS